MDVDVTGVFFCLKHELAQMAKACRGAIVNTIARRSMHGAVRRRETCGGGPDQGCRDRLRDVGDPGQRDCARLVRTPMTERWLNDPQMRPMNALSQQPEEA